MPSGRPELRHYESAIASNSKRHALLNQPLKHLRRRTESLLDSITGAGASEAPDVARAARFQRDREKAATCRKCGVVFADVKSLGLHHNLFPDHVKIEKKSNKRKHVPVRSQSEGDALDIASASAKRDDAAKTTVAWGGGSDVPLSSADLYAPRRATTTAYDDRSGLALSPDASQETRELAARFEKLETGSPSRALPTQALPPSPESPREQRNRLAGARSVEVLGRVTSSPGQGGSSIGSSTPREGSSRRNSQSLGVGAVTGTTQSSGRPTLKTLTSAIMATARAGDSQPAPVDVNLNLNLGLGRSTKNPRQGSGSESNSKQSTLIDLESPFDGLDLVSTATKEDNKKKKMAFFQPHSRSRSGDELTSTAAAGSKSRAAPPPPPSRLTTSFSDSPSISSPSSTRSLPGLPSRRLTNPFSFESKDSKLTALVDDEDGVSTSPIPTSPISTSSPTSSKTRRPPPQVPVRRREGSETSVNPSRSPLSPNNPFASYFAAADAQGSTSNRPATASSHSQLPSIGTTLPGPDYWSPLPPAQNSGSIAAPSSTTTPTLNPPRSPHIGAGSGSGSGVDAVSPNRSSMRAGAFRERSGRSSPSLGLGAGNSSSSLPYRRQGTSVHFPSEVAARAADNPRCPTCDLPFNDLKAVLAHLDGGECGAEIDGMMGI